MSLSETSLGSTVSFPRGVSTPNAVPMPPPPSAPMTVWNAVSCRDSGVKGFWKEASCSMGLWTASSAASVSPARSAVRPTGPVTKLRSAPVAATCRAPAFPTSFASPSLPSRSRILARRSPPPKRSTAAIAAPPAAPANIAPGSLSASGRSAICRWRMPKNEGANSANAGPNLEIACPAPATTALAPGCGMNAAALVSPPPIARAPTTALTEPAALPVADPNAETGRSTMSDRLCIPDTFRACTSWPNRCKALSGPTPGRSAAI